MLPAQLCQLHMPCPVLMFLGLLTLMFSLSGISRFPYSPTISAVLCVFLVSSTFGLLQLHGVPRAPMTWLVVHRLLRRPIMKKMLRARTVFPRNRRELKADATSLWHLLTRNPSNQCCPICQMAKAQKVRHMRGLAERKHHATVFGDCITADYVWYSTDTVKTLPWIIF